jgi:hypothetical protein
VHTVLHPAREGLMGTFAMSISEDGMYYRVQVVGDSTRELVRSVAVELTRVVQETQIHKAFVDLTQSRNIESVFRLYEMAYSDMAQKKIDKKLSIACLISPNDHSFDFLETVLRNAGFNFLLFTDRVAALEFLRYA